MSDESQEFSPFPKIARLSREVIVTEKIDGTNAQILIFQGHPQRPGEIATWFDETTGTDMTMYAGSRSRWLTRDNDNFGFANWAHEHAQELAQLGPGRHFGEWWGSGIQRGYGLSEKRFSLFNVSRWGEVRPACCHVVPELYRGKFCTLEINRCLHRLGGHGSVAAPGFMDPEGVVAFHTAANISFKKTMRNDDIPKQVTKRMRKSQ